MSDPVTSCCPRLVAIVPHVDRHVSGLVAERALIPDRRRIAGDAGEVSAEERLPRGRADELAFGLSRSGRRRRRAVARVRRAAAAVGRILASVLRGSAGVRSRIGSGARRHADLDRRVARETARARGDRAAGDALACTPQARRAEHLSARLTVGRLRIGRVVVTALEQATMKTEPMHATNPHPILPAGGASSIPRATSGPNGSRDLDCATCGFAQPLCKRVVKPLNRRAQTRFRRARNRPRRRGARAPSRSRTAAGS